MTQHPAFWIALGSEVRKHTETPAPQERIEVVLSVEGRIDGHHTFHSIHGWLKTGRKPRSEQAELEYLVASLLAAIPKGKRAALVKELRRRRIKRAKRLPERFKEARDLLASVVRRTDSEFTLTPTWKPRR